MVDFVLKIPREDEGRDFYFSPAQSENVGSENLSLCLTINDYKKKSLSCFKSHNISDNDVANLLKAQTDHDGYKLRAEEKVDDSKDGNCMVDIVILNGKNQITSNLTFTKIPMENAFISFLQLGHDLVQDMRSEKDQLEKKCQALEANTTQLESTLKDLLIKKNLMEDSLYRAFTKVLNSKKEKIKELQDAIDSQQPISSKSGRAGSGTSGRDRNILTKPVSRKLRKRYSDSEEDSASFSEENEVSHGAYNVDTDTEEIISEPNNRNNKVTIGKKRNAVLTISSSSSGTETDFSEDQSAESNIIPNTSTASSSSSNKLKASNYNISSHNVKKGESSKNQPNETSKIPTENDASSKYDDEVLFDEL